MRLPIRRPCMSVNATTTVSMAPSATCCRSSSRLSIPTPRDGRAGPEAGSPDHSTTSLRPRFRVAGLLRHFVHLRLEAAADVRHPVALGRRMAVLAGRERELLLRRQHETMTPCDPEVRDGDDVEGRDSVDT